MAAHLAIHCDRKPHLCVVCGHQFALISEHSLHMSAHNDSDHLSSNSIVESAATQSAQASIIGESSIRRSPTTGYLSANREHVDMEGPQNGDSRRCVVHGFQTSRGLNFEKRANENTYRDVADNDTLAQYNADVGPRAFPSLPRCPDSGHPFLDKDKLWMHRMCAHYAQAYTCQFCMMCFEEPAALEQHLAAVHRPKPAPSGLGLSEGGEVAVAERCTNVADDSLEQLGAFALTPGYEAPPSLSAVLREVLDDTLNHLLHDLQRVNSAELQAASFPITEAPAADFNSPVSDTSSHTWFK
ncbi:hypothetical protein V5799_030366 [Amblyomma americanum]|uniref:C2H2-type domain-containing protein n=1 Tax=Amblyomma americanum TaxID=6943 RepID=A0AAQ4ENY9_AMBAM